MAGGGLGSGPLSGDYGFGLPPPGPAGGLPCDFPPCGGPMISSFVSDVSIKGGEFWMFALTEMCFEGPPCDPTMRALWNAGNMAAPWANAAAIGTVAALAGPPVIAEAVTSGAGEYLFAKGGILNNNDYFRIGWSWYGRNVLDFLPAGGWVFRIVVGSDALGIHWHLWPF